MVWQNKLVEGLIIWNRLGELSKKFLYVLKKYILIPLKRQQIK